MEAAARKGPANRVEITDNLEELLAVLPERIQQGLHRCSNLSSLIEIVCDVGRIPEARFPGDTVTIDCQPVARDELDHVAHRVGLFTDDNRAGIERTLHRISALRNRHGEIVGLTCRVGRAVYGTVDVVRDVIESGRSVLLVGRPGVGKTTLLREAARVLADDLGRRVMIVDTSNEIAGDGDIPHPGIGRARRMQVPSPDRQHAVMIEAVENHMPQVVVIDEIGTAAEALAARTIAERGVQLIATAHGNSLENLTANPTLSDLIGGIQSVTLGDEEARRRRTQKTVLERKAPPTFDIVVEIHDQDRFAVHHDVAAVVDAMLRGAAVAAEVRVRAADGEVTIEAPRPAPPAETAAPRSAIERNRPLRILPHAIDPERLERAIRYLEVPAVVVDDPRLADVVLTQRAIARRNPRSLRALLSRGAAVHAAASASAARLEDALREIFDLGLGPDQAEALREAEEAVVAVISHQRSTPLPPRGAAVRRLQHQLAEAYGLGSHSVGREPNRRVVIDPAGT